MCDREAVYKKVWASTASGVKQSGLSTHPYESTSEEQGSIHWERNGADRANIDVMDMVKWRSQGV